jgi:hypothetical protein
MGVVTADALSKSDVACNGDGVWSFASHQERLMRDLAVWVWMCVTVTHGWRFISTHTHTVRSGKRNTMEHNP